MRRLFLVAAICLLVTPAAWAGATLPAFAPLSGEARSKAIGKVEAYLSGIPTAVAQFTQHSADGNTETGTFYLKRPGKVRWQYNPPSEQLLISNGSTMTYYDPSLKQVTYLGVDDTLASFVAQKTITLEGKTTTLSSIESTKAGDLRVTVTGRKNPSEGSLTLEFTAKPFALSRLTTRDATGNTTDIALRTLKIGPVLEDKLFVFTDPRSINDRRNKKR